ncbi:hypothetical protein [Sphingobacterium sp.]|uniref:hypothetical protein n=1 Tax=Sphingobacterium sp. TaxID=341027 RepID=UPI0028974B64|nr:hypothetical protein [Sphingobacterium sp.]
MKRQPFTISAPLTKLLVIEYLKLKMKVMEHKKPKEFGKTKLPYLSPSMHTMRVELEQGIAAGSASASGEAQQVWDNEESQSQSQNDGWW